MEKPWEKPAVVIRVHGDVPGGANRKRNRRTAQALARRRRAARPSGIAAHASGRGEEEVRRLLGKT